MNSENGLILGEEPKALRRRACLEEMREVINRTGPWSINKAHFARKYNFKRDTVSGWYSNLIKSIPPEKSETIRNMGMDYIKRAMAEIEKILEDEKASRIAKLKAIEKGNDTLKLVAPFMEAYGLKDKVAEKHEILTASLDLNKILEIAKEKAERMRKAQAALG